MNISSWPPTSTVAARAREEMLVSFDQDRPVRVLVLPALFDEANKLRRFTLSVMRALDDAGIDTALPDLPGMNESLAPLAQQTLAGWREHAAAVAQRFRATNVLAFRGASLFAPDSLPGWRYAPIDGARLLATLLRARLVEAREAGREETREGLMETGRSEGLTLGGWPLSATMTRELEGAVATDGPEHETVEPADFGASGLWLRAEPADDAMQAKALAAQIARSVNPSGETAS